MCENPEPKPADEKPAAEIRGGNRPADYISSDWGEPEGTVWGALMPPDDEDDEED